MDSWPVACGGLMWVLDALFHLSSLLLPTPPSSPPAPPVPLGSNSSLLPIVTWHGINDDHRSMLGLIRALEAAMPGVAVLNLRLGATRGEERERSITMGMEEQVAWACRQVAGDPRLAGGYTGIGYSQGGLLLRGWGGQPQRAPRLAQLCPEPPMVRLVTIGSPHQGIAGLPRCPGKRPLPSPCPLSRPHQPPLHHDALPPLCRGLPALCARSLTPLALTLGQTCWPRPSTGITPPTGRPSYTGVRRPIYSPCTARFLPLVNNEGAAKSEEVREGLARLQLFVMVMWG